MAPECSLKRGFWVLAPNILKKRKEDPFACRSQMLTCHKVSQGPFALWLYIFTVLVFSTRRGEAPGGICADICSQDQVHDMENRNINRSLATLMWLASWLFKWEDFLGRNQSWCKRSLFLLPLFGKKRTKQPQISPVGHVYLELLKSESFE